MLRAVLIDDERPALDELSYLMKENSVEVIGAFQNTTGVLSFIQCEKPDIVFLDIEMRGENGIDFGVELQKDAGDFTIIFVTAYPEYALEAFQAYPLDYVVKPVDEERLAQTLRHVQKTLKCRNGTENASFYIRCFGKFEILYGEDEVKLPTKKARELFAYLLCNEGTIIYREDLMRLVFSGDPGKAANNLRVSLFRIRTALREAGVTEDKFLIQDDFSVRIADGACDLVDLQRFIKNNPMISTSNIAKAEKIAGLVSGDLLSDIDALWITEVRELIMAQAEELLVNMSVFYLSGDSPKQAESALIRFLTLNPLSERGYHRLLDLYRRSGNPVKYRYCFERYQEMMEKEFREPPSRFYIDFYKKCLGST